MAYYATETLQPITAGGAKTAEPTSGLGCAPCAAAAGLGAAPIVAVSGLGDLTSEEWRTVVVLGVVIGLPAGYWLLRKRKKKGRRRS